MSRVTFIARGASMRPFIRDGDEVTVAEGRPRCGDAVMLAQGNVHRVLWVARDGRLLVKGDALPLADGWFSPDAVLGRVIEVRRRGRRVRQPRALAVAVSVLGGAARRWRARLPLPRIRRGAGRRV